MPTRVQDQDCICREVGPSWRVTPPWPESVKNAAPEALTPRETGSALIGWRGLAKVRGQDAPLRNRSATPHDDHGEPDLG